MNSTTQAVAPEPAGVHAAGSSAVVQTDELTKRFGDFVALDRLSISVDRGQILGFIGPNGAGKTTTIRILVGLSKPTSGHATISGIDCTGQSKKIKRAVGYMPDKFGVYDNMRVREYLDFFAAVYGLPPRQRKQRIAEVMDTTNCTYMQDKFVESLSHGMQQRVGIARIMLHDPEVLILDEPANGLDPQARIEMREILLNLAAMGKTLIVTSHILPELSRICNTVAILTGGKLRAFGSLDSVMKELCPRQTFEVQLLDQAQAQQAADWIEGWKDDDEIVTVMPGQSLVRLETNRTERALADLLRELITRDIHVAQFREVPSDLEDAFVSVTRAGDDDSVADDAKAAN
ncbi:ABC transporter ATP-binding protein [Crateriforma conspicua]|uniref:ABC transporter ATP-binding protein n=1 Tax=Crateriforma conspicua TaxID=2527996 RepID=UPI001E646D13|nr:ABC transporter ATP-binding protein [Crateriforma conspicua]